MGFIVAQLTASRSDSKKAFLDEWTRCRTKRTGAKPAAMAVLGLGMTVVSVILLLGRPVLNLVLEGALDKEEVGLAVGLVRLGAGVLTKSPKNNEGILGLAASTGKVALVREMLDRGADPNEASAKGVTVIEDAAANGRTEIVQLLLDRGADPEIEDAEGHNALDAARLYSKMHIVRMLSSKRRSNPLSPRDGIPDKVE